MPTSRMQEFLSGLKSHDEERRVRTAYDLQRYVFTELREISVDALITFLHEFNNHIYNMVTSSGANEKKGAIYAIICLMDIDEGQKTQSLSRSYNFLTNLITSSESGVSELAVKALGRLLLVSGAPTVTGVEMLLDKHFSYIEHDEPRRKLAILLVKELCLSVPSQFYQQIRRFFDIILEFGIWDSDATVREESVATITVALTVGLQREAKEPNIPQWYPSCIHEILRGLEDVRAGEHIAAVPRNISREERLHVTFLLLNALLKHANAAWEARMAMLRHVTHYHTAQPKKEGVTAMIRRLRGNSSSSIGLPTSHSLDQLVISAQQQHQHHPSECERPVESNIIRTMLDENYTKLCSLIAGFRSNRNALVQSSLYKLLPRLAAFRPAEFANDGHLEAYLKHCLTIAQQRDTQKSAAYVCIGLLTIACQPATLPSVPKIMRQINTSLLHSKESMSRKRGPHTAEPGVLVCLSLVAHSLGPAPALPELLALDQHPPPPSPAQIDDAAVRANEAQDAIESLLDSILTSGLSPTLALCMQELALVLPGLKSHISDGLLSLLSGILIQRGGPSPSSSGPSPSDPQHTATIVLALRTLATFEFEETAGPWLLQVIRHISDHYVGHDNKEVRLEAVATVCHLLRPVCLGAAGGLPRHHHPPYNPLCNDHSAQHPLHAAIIYEHVSKVLWLSVTDMESDVRLCALASLETGFSVHLAQPENLQALVLALNDEVLEIRETAVTLLARLSVINPAYVHPLLRNLLLRVLGELDFTGIGRNRELSARTLRHLIARAPRFLRQYARPVMSVVVPILSQPDLNPVVTVSLMTAVGDLAQVSGSDILPWVPSVLPLLLSMLESGLCGWRRQVALVTLGQLVEATAGGVHHPYTQYPYLLQLLLSILKTETQQPVRRETLRVLGLLGAVDPYKHKMNVGAITIQRDTGVAVITIEDQDDNSQGPLVLSPSGPSEMLVNQSYGSMDEYYAACSVAAMLRMLREPSLAQYHDKVSVAINFTYKNLGAKGVPFLSLVVPSMLQVVRSCDQNYCGNFLTRLASFIETVGQHIRNYVDDIVDVIKLFWVPDVSPELAPPLILVVKSVAVAMGVEFKVHLKDIMPLILKSLMADGKEKLITKSLLDMFSEFGVNLEEFLHVLVPHITKLFDGADVPLKVRASSITTMQSLAVDINMGDYVSRIVHPLLRTIDQWPELRRESLELLTTLIATLENTYSCFIPVTNAILTKHKIVDYNYDLLVAKVVRGYAISDDERADATFGRGAKKPNHSLYDVPKPNTPSNDAKGLGFNSKKAVWVELEKSLEFQRHTSKDEWMQWLLSIGMNLLKASPSVALKAVYPVSSGYPQVARDLFNVSFMAAWSEMNEALQDTFLSSLKNALKSQDIPEVTQALLNLTEFMEHSDKGPLPLEVSQLGYKAMECRAYAKALHYKEEQFPKSPTAEVLQNLISINNKLGQEEAATGLLEYARKHNSSDMQLEERWFEKVHDWDQALELYNAKLEKTPENFDLALGKMRCMEALGEWDQLYETTLRWWDSNNDPESVGSLSDHYRSQMARLASSACWAAEEWSMMERAVAYTPADTQTGAFYRAVLAVQQGVYDKAQQLINLARDLHDAELTAMSGESYERAYSSMVAVQTLAELEEVVQYSLVQERRPAIKNIWYQRLQSNQRVVDDWHKILLVRSLVLKPQEDMRPWLEFAAMCRKSSRFSLAKKTLVSLLGCDPDTAPDQPLPIACPNASYEYAKYLYTQEGQQLKAYNKLQTFVNHLNHAATNVHHEPSLRSLISKVYLKLGEWHESIYGMKEETLPVITTYNNHARATNEHCYKAWHAYAYSNFQALLLHQAKLDLLQNRAAAAANASASRDGSRSSDGTSEDGDASDGDDAPTAAMAAMAFPANSEDVNKVQKRLFGLACEAVKGFIRSITVGGSSNSVQDCLRLLTIWFQHGHHKPVEQVLHDGLKTVHVDTWLQMIPQLIARIDTPRPNVSQLVHQVLTDFGRQHPQALLYPLTVAAKSSDRLRSNAAEQLLNKMREHSPVLVNQAATVSEELIRVAILRNERWHEALEEASRLYFSERNEQAMLRMLMPLHSMMDRDPETLNESAFNQTYGRDLSEAKDWCLRFQRSGNVRDLNQAWELYYNVFKRIARQLSTLTTLELHSVSPRLLACRDLDIAVPGSYAPNAPLICISYVHPSLQVLSTKQRPRKLCIRASTGHDIMFLLKGHEDLRQDERVMQLFGLVNTFLINNPETFRRNLTVQRYAVVPLSINSGLIGWLPHCDTLHVLIKDWREKKKHIQINIEHKLMLMMAPSLCHLTVMQKVEVFEHALEFTQGDDLAKLLWLKSPSSEVWFDRRTNYTRSLAAMSMIGYVLGLGDRHPSNLMLDQKSGKIIHIDFGDCFEVAMTREKYPEKIPFRLTRMLVKAMEVTGIDGTYRMTCESVMTLLRRNKDSVMAMLEAFIYDPLWRVMDQQPPATPYGSRRGDNNTVMASSATGAAAGDRASAAANLHNLNGIPETLNKKAVAIVNRVRDKLTGRDFPNQDEPLDVPKQVDLLIAQATNHENLCQCYIGWCPFW